MKFKTRLIVTFFMIIILPIVLTVFAFLGIGGYLANRRNEYGLRSKDYEILLDPSKTFTSITNEIFVKVKSQASQDAGRIEDVNYLNEISKDLNANTSYVIVRKGQGLYYTDNQIATDTMFHRLPAFKAEEAEEADMDVAYYYNDMQKIVRQLDFYFKDGSQGSFFIITHINNAASRTLFIDMMFAVVIILVFTSIMLTRWIRKGVFLPVNELNIAMQNIAEGNLDYVLVTENRGEIGELYRNYEDMRLQLKETTDEKIKNDKKNRELISNISHDLKTPITAIKGYVEGIMDGVADTPEKMDKYIKTIYNKANDMDRLINELTIYSGIDSNRIPYNFHRLNVADYFGDCIEEVGFDLESKDIELNYSNLVSPDTVIIADPEQLKRVVNNIIGNSIKYIDKTKEKGIIDIRILDDIDSVRIEIEDNGRGIAAKDLSHIFERFYRTDASRNSAKGGSGIGLSIVKKIVEDHGGYIWATSKEREGTCIHFVFRKYQNERDGEMDE